MWHFFSRSKEFTGESKVRWSPVIPTWHSCSATEQLEISRADISRVSTGTSILMGYRSPARCSHSFPSVRDRCFCKHRYRRCGVATCSLRYFHLLPIFPLSCAHRSHYRPVPITRLSRSPLPWLMVILQLSKLVFAFLNSFLFHSFSLHTTFLASRLSLSPSSLPQPAEPGSTLATLKSGCGEDFAFNPI